MQSKIYHEELKKRIDDKTLNHAYIFNGTDQVEIKKIVNELVLYYYCLDPQKIKAGACHHCTNCKAILANQFMGIRELKNDGQIIKIDQIRALTHDAEYSDFSNKAKFIIIYESELMNDNAQNAFLKYLESPGSDRYFFLLTRNMYLLLPTIVSRCQVLYFSNDEQNDDFSFDPLIESFFNLILKRDPLAYIVLTTEIKELIDLKGPEYFLSNWQMLYHRTRIDHEVAQMLGFLTENLPATRQNISFQNLLERFCLEMLSEG